MTILTLGQDGIAYVESCLRQGTGLSAKALSLPLKGGEAFAPVPNDISLDRARSFNTGGLMFRQEAITWLVKHAQTLWRSWPVGTLVIQDVWVRSSDPAAQRSCAKTFFQDQNVYYFCQKADSDSIPRAIGAASSYLFIAFFSRSPIRDTDLPPDRIVREDLIDEIVRNTQEIFVSAYDQEGLIVWRRQSD